MTAIFLFLTNVPRVWAWNIFTKHYVLIQKENVSVMMKGFNGGSSCSIGMLLELIFHLHPTRQSCICGHHPSPSGETEGELFPCVFLWGIQTAGLLTITDIRTSLEEEVVLLLSRHIINISYISTASTFLCSVLKHRCRLKRPSLRNHDYTLLYKLILRCPDLTGLDSFSGPLLFFSLNHLGQWQMSTLMSKHHLLLPVNRARTRPWGSGKPKTHSLDTVISYHI